MKGMRSISTCLLLALMSCAPPLGTVCNSDSACGEQGQCVDGVCCDTACGGECQACTRAKTGQPDGTCAPVTKDADPDEECAADLGACLAAACDGAGSCRVAAGTTCRASSGVCDAAEVCGAQGACPADGFAATTVECRASSGACDLPETCPGSSAQCPPDARASAGTVCRAAAGTCDVAEACDGTAAECPADAFVAALTDCRPAAGVCDLPEQCTGTGPACPVDSFATSARSCRAATGVCDTEEFCSGAAAACPADALAPASTTCRAAAGDCDVAEQCTGAHPDCPADQHAPLGQVCRATTGACDPEEACTGANSSCPGDVLLPANTTATCSPYTCGGAASCRTACTSTAQCAAGFACSAMQCKPAKLVFVTSTASTGALGGLAGADATCMARAQAANFPGTFKAWLSTAAVSPSTSFARHTGPYVLPNGVVVADDWADLTDGTLDAPINIDETGAFVFARVWTNTQTTGAVGSNTHCTNWTAATNTNAWPGGTSFSSGAWTNSGFDVCTLTMRLYCFEQ